MSRRLIVALVVTGALSGLLAAWVLHPSRGSVLPSLHFGRSSATAPARPDPTSNVVAVAKVASIPIYDQPDLNTPAKLRLANPTEDGAPLVFLVHATKSGWFQVLLPVRPNGSVGWIQDSLVTTSKHRWRIVVQLNEHHITVYNGDGVFMSAPVGVGRGPTPTPLGVFYTKELLRPPDPNTAYGAYAYGISGYSNVLTDFAGGDGLVGLHGTNDPSTIGQDVSHGCIRLTNENITRLAKTLPLGVPVVIEP
jgi:lipoprotein-anchoring transpeptidase ErfK/SrfK